MNKSLYQERRMALLSRIKGNGPVVLFAGFEGGRSRFRQESTFYYFSGIQEPGAVLIIAPDGKTTVYIHQFTVARSVWVSDALEPTSECAQQWGVDAIEYLGQPVKGYEAGSFFVSFEYENLIQYFNLECSRGKHLYCIAPVDSRNYFEQRFQLERLMQYAPECADKIIDISTDIADMRRTKSQDEIGLLYQAIGVTIMAHEAAAHTIVPGCFEGQVQGAIDYIYAAHGAYAAFPSIIGSGANSTVLHYTRNNGTMRSGDVVVVDIGAELDYYCADLTRTYPVSGAFNKRQREVYEIVLRTQEYIADMAKPGMWLSNAEHKDQSLNHLAHEFVREKGYGDYFPHGVGHYLGLDVHDVGGYETPLRPGDVITIEPGIYIPQEQLGVRIEDDFWIVDDGAVCLSEELPRDVGDIEAMMREKGGL